MKKLLLLSATGLVFSTGAFAQFSEFDNIGTSPFTLSSDNNTLQIGGRFSGYFENRSLKAGQTNMAHNGWAVKDMDLDILGKTSNKFVYEFHMSVIDMVTAAATQNTANPANSGIKAAYLGYNGFLVHIKLGYDKLPYSQGSMSDVWGMPLWSHANLYGGDLFSRRDFGLTMNSHLLNNKVNLYAGAYSGLGENFFEYGNDASAKMEFIGRAEFCYPGKMKYDNMDNENSPTPTFRVGANARYMDKTQPTGHSVNIDVPDAPGAYNLRIIDGKRLAYGADAIVKYKGFSATFEAHMMNLQPTSQTNILYQGTQESLNGNVVHAGGYEVGLNYNNEKIHSAFSVQYEEINANDLAVGIQDWLYLGYAYKVSGYNSVFKIQYYIPTTEDAVSNPLKYTNQLRVGYQVVF